MNLRDSLLLLVMLFPAAAVAQTAVVPPAPAAEYTPPPMESREVAVLQVLDKISARVTTLRVPVNMQAAFGQLVITPRACRVSSPSAPPESVAFLEIGEIDINSVARSGGGKAGAHSQKLIFSGWMYASSPALSALEHPIYDVLVLKCESKEAAKAEQAKPAEAPAVAKPAPAAPADDAVVPLD